MIMLPRYTATTCIGKRNWSQIHRPITRFFSKSETHNDDINDYLSTLGYTDSTMKVGMRDALQSVFGNQMTLSQVKGFGEEGLKALSKSVEKQQASQSTNSFVGTVHINIPHHNYSFDLKVRKGESIMSCVKFGSGRELLGEYLEFACGGNMSCSTCHVYLDHESFYKLNPPCAAEEDMIDLAYKPKTVSRLSCQIVMDETLDGMTITIPPGVNNLWG